MKRLKFILGLVAGTAVLSMMGCDLAVRNPYSNDIVGGVTEDTNNPGYFDLSIANFKGDVYNTDKTAIDAAKAYTVYDEITQAPVKWDNPLNGEDLEGATIIYEIYNYGDVNALGNLWGFYSTDGRFYMTPSMYLGYNATGGYFDANLINYGPGTHKIDSQTWVKIAVVLTGTGYAVYADGNELYNTSTLVSPNVKIEPTDFNYGYVLDYLSGAEFFVIGSGNWWTDEANSYIKGIKLISKALDKDALENLFDGEIEDAPEPEINEPQKVNKLSDYYELAYDAKFTKSIGGETAIDAYTYQSNITHDSKPQIWWESPLYGMKAEELKDGITIQADVYTPGNDKSGGHDALLSFYKPGDPWNAVSIGEGGVLRINAGGIGGWYENLDDAQKGEWITVTIIFNSMDTIKYYVGNTDKNATLSDLLELNASYDNIVNYFTEIASNVGVGVGFADSDGCRASFVDQDCGIKNIRIYPKAISVGED